MILNKDNVMVEVFPVFFFSFGIVQSSLWLTAWRLQIDDDGCADIVSLHNHDVSWVFSSDH
ncbi:hypothetical protein BDV34DRAFT_189473 [Aspergillus parasiticus]|uniref:Uncharacterized protein n=1 Tax=Aspergillus parasiticus TaxID=5067 RepID=A0A5N6DUH2_ASPPA|nr:hypothetical protein BDV34DRAFT_189473 [Aspergillus parasiticus]